MKNIAIFICFVFLLFSEANSADVKPAVVAPVAEKPARNTAVEVVKDLKEQDKAGYEDAKGAKKTTAKDNRIVSTSVVVNTGAPGEEVVLSKPAVGATVVPNAAKAVISKPNAKAPSAKVIQSDDVILDAADAREAQRQKTHKSTNKAASDYAVPEAGGRVVEKITRQETTERMVPPPDDVLYGALKRAETKVGTANAPIVIEAIQGVNELVTISRSDLNRFVTPFEKVKVRTVAGEEELVSKVDGNIVYLGATKKAGVFLTEIGTDRAISLTLVPDDVPPRDIYIKLNRATNIPSQLTNVTRNVAKANGILPGSSGDSDGTSGKSQSHVDVIKDIMRDMALGKIPGGYTMTVPKSGEFKCNIPGFRMRLGQSIEGSSTKIMVFRAENSSNSKELLIDEQYCYKRGVVAVAAWPDVVVPPGGATEVYVITKISDGKTNESSRPSLIGREPAVHEDRDD